MSVDYSDRSGDWIETASGGRFYPEDIRPGDFKIEDIAHALSLINRFTGHCRVAYSVAEHSVRCLWLARQKTADDRSLLCMLLHDASEAYLCDIARPIKRMPQFAGYRRLEDWIGFHINREFGVNGILSKVNQTAIDLTLLATEARDLMPSGGEGWHLDYEPLPDRIYPWTARRSKRLFLEEYEILAARISESTKGDQS